MNRTDVSFGHAESYWAEREDKEAALQDAYASGRSDQLAEDLLDVQRLDWMCVTYGITVEAIDAAMTAAQKLGAQE